MEVGQGETPSLSGSVRPDSEEVLAQVEPGLWTLDVNLQSAVVKMLSGLRR